MNGNDSGKHPGAVMATDGKRNPGRPGKAGGGNGKPDDPIRARIPALLWKKGLSMKKASTAIGRHGSFLHQFISKGTPKVLAYRDAERLAALLGCEPADLHHDELPPRRKPSSAQAGAGARASGGTKAGPAHAPAGMPENPESLVGVPEMAIEASAGPGAFIDHYPPETAQWFLPASMVRHEGNADPASLRILRVRGESMEPELSDGDRLVVEISRTVPVTGELCVLWDGNGLVVKRIEHLPGADGPPAVRLKSANPDYADYECLAQDLHVSGRVLWSIRKM